MSAAVHADWHPQPSLDLLMTPLFNGRLSSDQDTAEIGGKLMHQPVTYKSAGIPR